MISLVTVSCCCSVAESCLTLYNPMDYSTLGCSVSFSISWSLRKPMSIESVIPSNHLILCCSLLHLPSIFPSIRVFSSNCSYTKSSKGYKILIVLFGAYWIMVDFLIFFLFVIHIFLKEWAFIFNYYYYFYYYSNEKPLDESERGEWKSWLKAQHSEN